MRNYFAALLLLLQLPCAYTAGGKFEQLVEKMEADALELRRVVEDTYQKRCDTSILNVCQASNYDDCNSLFPNPTCPEDGGDQRLQDFTASSIRVPEILKDGQNGNPTDAKAIEAICFTRLLEDYFQRKTGEDRAFWARLGAPPPQMYFGSNSGPIRIYPARYSANCQDYDPRVRPWYSASSSGPKNVLLILDVSGSMDTNDRITSMKEAAKVIVNTLTVTDRVALIPFSGSADIIADERQGQEIMFQASAENKKRLVQAIDKLEAAGPTNFLAAFNAAFKVFEQSSALELTADCTTAVLFLTDGRMTHPTDVTEDEVLAQINAQISEMEAKTRNPIFVFTYSVSFDDNLVDEFPKRLACSSRDGVWSRIGETDEIFESLVGYSQLFALGLGEEQNEDFTAWVEPYEFSSGIMGVTVSAPVYDRSKSPPLFIGVVGVDNTLEVFSNMLEEDGSDETFLESIVKRSAARCPQLDRIPLCLLESYRRRGRAGDAALCSNNCTNSFLEIEERSCPAVSDYPKELIDNYEQKGNSFNEKQKLSCGGAESGSSGSSGTGIGVAVGVPVAVAMAALVGIGIFVKKRQTRKRLQHVKLPPLPPPTAPKSTEEDPFPAPMAPAKNV